MRHAISSATFVFRTSICNAKQMNSVFRLSRQPYKWSETVTKVTKKN